MKLNKYMYNKTLDIDNNTKYTGKGIYINGQARAPYAKYRIGIDRVNNVGCGAIAVYNAIVDKKGSVDLADIIEFIENQKLGLFFDGKLGINPFSINKCLRYFGYTTNIIFTSNFNKACANSRTSIILYAWKQNKKTGAHYATVSRTKGVYDIYNLFNDDDKVYRTDNLNDYFSKERRICVINVI